MLVLVVMTTILVPGSTSRFDPAVEIVQSHKYRTRMRTRKIGLKPKTGPNIFSGLGCVWGLSSLCASLCGTCAIGLFGMPDFSSNIKFLYAHRTEYLR